MSFYLLVLVALSSGRRSTVSCGNCWFFQGFHWFRSFRFFNLFGVLCCISAHRRFRLFRNPAIHSFGIYHLCRIFSVAGLFVFFFFYRKKTHHLTVYKSWNLKKKKKITANEYVRACLYVYACVHLYIRTYTSSHIYQRIIILVHLLLIVCYARFYIPWDGIAPVFS